MESTVTKEVCLGTAHMTVSDILTYPLPPFYSSLEKAEVSNEKSQLHSDPMRCVAHPGFFLHLNF